jgi:hypothetical protein
MLIIVKSGESAVAPTLEILALDYKNSGTRRLAAGFVGLMNASEH